MHQEKEHTIPLPETEPEVGVGVPAPADPGQPDYEVAERVIAGSNGLGYSPEELNRFVEKDQKYQELCRLKKLILMEPEVDPETVLMLERKVRHFFSLWQRMKNRATVKAEELTVLRGQMYARMRLIAIQRAIGDIRRIQAVIGVATMKEGQGGKEFLARLSGPQQSQVTEIVRILQEPLVSPLAQSKDESQNPPS